jgi:hypothetical protein
MPGLKDWFAIFKTGEHTDSKGNKKTWTTDDLDKMVSTFAGATSLPLVVGHPKNADPAFGWADELKREGNILYAKAKDVVAEFEAAVAQKIYPNRSIAVDKNCKLLHIGFLGGAVPAVENLPPIEFSAEDDAEVVEFSAFEPEDNKKTTDDDKTQSQQADKEVRQQDAEASFAKEIAEMFGSRFTGSRTVRRTKLKRFALVKPRHKFNRIRLHNRRQLALRHQAGAESFRVFLRGF